MSDAVGIAFGALTPLGEGGAALPTAGLGEGARVAIADDARLRRAGLTRCAAARIPGERGIDAAEVILTRALDACVARLDVVRPGWRSGRVGLVLGTSSGAMANAEVAYQALAEGRAPSRTDARALAYAAPFAEARKRVGAPLAREAHVLAACASSTLALGLAHAWLAAGDCDLVLAGGYDALTLFVAAGFSAIASVTSSTPRPFTRERDGLALGEGASVVALVRAEDAPPSTRSLLTIAGFGMSTDAVHLTAPDREGRGLARAIGAALARAGTSPTEIGMIGAHATATPYNDAAEMRAFALALGPRVADVPVHAPKAAVGHLLGGAGVIETLALAHGLNAEVAQPSAGAGERDPDAPARLVRAGERHPAVAAVKTSLAFGGVNTALVLRARARVRACSVPRAPVLLGYEGEAAGGGSLDDLAARVGVKPERLARLDDLSRVVIAAIAELAGAIGRDRVARAALVVGHDVATVATNAAFWARITSRGARFAEPRKFPYTSPNACAGEAALVFGIRGPSFAVGGAPGLTPQAFEVACDLVRAGLVEEAIAVEATEGSPAGAALFAAFDLAPGATRATARLIG